MSEAPADDLPRRGTLGVLMLIVPIVSITLVGAAYGVLAWKGAQGRAADGPEVRMVFQGCPEAEAAVRERLAFMGLPEPKVEAAEGGFAVTTRLPGEPRLLTQIPATLASQGRVVVREGEDGPVLATEADVVEVTVVPTFLDVPRARIVLGAVKAEALKLHMGAHLDAYITVWLDGDVVSRRHNAPPEEHGELDLELPELPAETRIDRAAHAAAVLTHGPLPCALTVAEVVTVSPGGAP